MKGWVKLNLYYLGESKKHQIFRVKNWKKDFERVYKKPIYNEKYEQQGYIQEIFGPIKLPFISVKTLPDREFNPENEFYIKV